ncbi:hypothetical protein Tco_1105057, partial [Tanacetum coccineum]
TGNGPDWLFDVDSLIISMNYVPVVVGNQANGIVETKDNIITGQAEKKTEPEQEYILIPICITDPLISQDPKVSEEDAEEKPTKMDENGASDKDRKDDQATRMLLDHLLLMMIHHHQLMLLKLLMHLRNIYLKDSPFKNAFTLPPPMDDTGIFGNAYDDEDVGADADLNNLETTMNVSPIPTTRIDKDHPKDQIIRDFNSSIQNGVGPCFLMNMLWGFCIPDGCEGSAFICTIEAERLFVCPPLDCTVNEEAGNFISQDKYVAEILKKFDFATVKIASTPIETNKALVKDEEAKAVDVHLYKSMFGSLMYLTASRPDIMFAVCACARFNIDFEAFSVRDYVGAVLWIQNQMLDYGFNFMNIKIYIDNESTICIVRNPVFHSKTKHIEIRHHFIRDSYEKKLIQVIKIHADHNVADLLTKAFDVSRFNFLIASIGLLNL